MMIFGLPCSSFSNVDRQVRHDDEDELEAETGEDDDLEEDIEEDEEEESEEEEEEEETVVKARTAKQRPAGIVRVEQFFETEAMVSKKTKKKWHTAMAALLIL